MKKLNFLSIYLLVGSLLMLAPRMALAQDPVGMLDSVAKQMINNLKMNKASIKTHPAKVYSIAYKIVVPHADLDVMARNVLPPQVWAKATAGQQSEFKKEFTSLLVRTYASALAEYKDETVRFYPLRAGYQGKSNVTVNSIIVRSNAPNISLSYKVVRQGSQWKLYDMSVEGISMLQSFRSQFADKLSQGNMGALIAALKQHNVSRAGA